MSPCHLAKIRHLHQKSGKAGLSPPLVAPAGLGPVGAKHLTEKEIAGAARGAIESSRAETRWKHAHLGDDGIVGY